MATSAKAAGTQVIGKAFIVYGSVKAVAPDGTVRVLGPNSVIYADERIVTESDGGVSLMLDGPPPSQIVYAGAPPEAVTDASADAEKIQEALEGKGDIELDATAAGGAAGTGGATLVQFSLTGAEGNVTSGAETTGFTQGTVDTFREAAAPDDTPIGGIDVAAVDEDGLELGNKDEARGDHQAELSSFDGNLTYTFGNDGQAAVNPFVWSMDGLAEKGVESQGHALQYEVSEDGLTLTAYYEESQKGDYQEWVRVEVFTVTVTDVATGAYTFTLLQPLDHAEAGTEDDIVYNFTYTLTDGNGTTGTGSLGMTIDDDMPVSTGAEDMVISNVGGGGSTTNLIITLDVSGSMGDHVTGDVSKLDIAKEGLEEMIEKYQANGDVMVQLTTFAGTATNHGWMSADDAIAYIRTLDADGSTNYEDALKHTYLENDGDPITIPTADQTVAYFISDGAPTAEIEDGGSGHDIEGDDGEAGWLDSSYVTAWTTFVDDNVDNLNVIGVGNDLSMYYLNVVAVGEYTPLVIDDPAELLVTLLDSVSGDPISATASLGIDFGADGPALVNAIQLTGPINLGGHIVDNAGNVLTSGGLELEYVSDGAGGLIAQTVGATHQTIFTISVDPANGGTYTTTMIGELDAPASSYNVGLTTPGEVPQEGMELTFTSPGIIVTVTGTADYTKYTPTIENPSHHDHIDDGPYLVKSTINGVGIDQNAQVDNQPSTTDEHLTLTFTDSAGQPVYVTSATVTLNNLGDEEAHWKIYNGDELVASGEFEGEDNVVANTLTINTGDVFDRIELSADDDASYSVAAVDVDVQQNVNPVITYTVLATDGDGDTVTSTLDITINDAPDTNAGFGTGNEDAASITVSLSGTDAGGTVASFVITSLPENGDLYSDAGLTTLIEVNDIVAATGNAAKVYFVPDENYNGSPTFQYAAIDNNGAQDGSPATATITVNAVNDAPVAVDDTLSSVNEDSGAIKIYFTELTGNDSKGPANESGQTLTVTAVSNVVGGTVNIDSDHLHFTPTLNFNGTASFDYTVQDNGHTGGDNDFKTDIGHASFTVTPVNDAPDTSAGSGTGNEDATYIAVSLSGTDVDGTVASFKITSLPANGTLYSDAGLTTLIAVNDIVAAAGNLATVYFDPNPNYNGSPTFQYIAIDDSGAQDMSAATATITVTPDAGPGANADTILTAVNHDATFTVPQWALLHNDTAGHDGPAAAITSVSESDNQLDGVTISGSIVSVNTHDNFDPLDVATFSYVANDGSLNSNSTPATVTVKAVADSNITGTASAEIIVDSSSGHTVNAGDGNDIVFGNAGDDTLNGEGGNDILVGGTGHDHLTGGAGADTFIIGSGDSPANAGDIITDFSTSTDFLDLAGTPLAAANVGKVDGTDSSSQFSSSVGSHTHVESHSISNGVITFDNVDTYANPLAIDSTEKVAAVVDYLQKNDIGDAGTTVAFNATISGTAHTYIYEQVGNTQSSSNDILVDLSGTTVPDLSALIDDGHVV
jgi:hypothetical protein